MTTADANVAFRRLGRGTSAGLLVTLAIHGALALVVYQSQVRSAPRPEAERNMIITRTIKFQKPREKPWLPRIVAPPVVETPPPVIKVAEDPLAPPTPPTPPKPKEAPKPEDKLSKDMKRALERARTLARAAAEEPEEGPLSNATTGTSNEQVEGDPYATEIHNAIQRNWNAPSGLLNDAQLAGLSADVRIHIDADGTLKNPSLVKSSGNDLFDDSCLQAVRATSRVPPPPLNQRARWRRGAVIEFEGKDLAR